MVDSCRHTHRDIARRGKPLHAVYEVLVLLHAVLQQVQDRLYGIDNTSGDIADARLPGSGQDSERWIHR